MDWSVNEVSDMRSITSPQVRYILGTLFIELAVLLLIPAVISRIYHEPTSVRAFVDSAAMCAVLGLVLRITAPKTESLLNRRQAVCIIVVGWLVAILVGAIPFVMNGMDVASGIFESASGWSAMGGTVLLDGNNLGYYTLLTSPYITIMGLLFWRSLMQLVGGLGILLVVVAAVTHNKNTAKELYHAEAIGTEETKVPLVSNTITSARMLWMTYLGLNVLETLILKACNMNWYDAVTHSMATVATGGYSPYVNSIMQFNNIWIEVVTAMFIVIGGSNLGLIYSSIKNRNVAYIHDEEFKFALKIMAVGSVLVLLFGNIHGDLITQARYAIYTVISFGYTCGFVNNMDYNNWSEAAKMVLIGLMVVGGCLGSTAGGIKMGRVLVCIKYINYRLETYFHPRKIGSIKVNNNAVQSESVTGIVTYALLYMGVWILCSILLACCEFQNNLLDMTGITAAIASSLAGVGPAFSQIWSSYCYLTPAGKLVCALCMYIGRLEMLPILAIYTNKSN
jgi:trk system potassium uptake protein